MPPTCLETVFQEHDRLAGDSLLENNSPVECSCDNKNFLFLSVFFFFFFSYLLTKEINWEERRSSDESMIVGICVNNRLKTTSIHSTVHFWLIWLFQRRSMGKPNRSHGYRSVFAHLQSDEIFRTFREVPRKFCSEEMLQENHWSVWEGRSTNPRKSILMFLLLLIATWSIDRRLKPMDTTHLLLNGRPTIALIVSANRILANNSLKGIST